MKVLPGKMHVGPETATGHRPVYVGNGMQAYVVTMFAFLFASYKLELFPASIIYDHMGPIITFMNLFSLLFCAFLYLKGTYYPSTRDNGKSAGCLAHHALPCCRADNTLQHYCWCALFGQAPLAASSLTTTGAPSSTRACLGGT